MHSAIAFLQEHAGLGMGSWHLGQGRRSRDEEKAALLTGAQLGLSVIDTAEMYGDGLSEELIGDVLREWPSAKPRPFLVSKVLPMHASRKGVMRAFEASAYKLGVECIDLYLLHWRGNTPLAETVAAFEDLKTQGKIRHWGVSNFDTDDMQELWQVPGGSNCVVNQVLYNVFSRGIEYDLLPWCQNNGVTVMAYCPLGHGELIEQSLLAEIGGRHGVSASVVALAWALRSGHVLPIPESGSADHIRDNVCALQLRLSAEELALIDAASPRRASSSRWTFSEQGGRQRQSSGVTGGAPTRAGIQTRTRSGSQTNAHRSHSCSRVAGACVAMATSTLTFDSFADPSGSPMLGRVLARSGLSAACIDITCEPACRSASCFVIC